VTPRALAAGAAGPVFSAGWLRNQGVVILVALAAAAVLSLIARFGVGRVGKRMGERSGWAGAFGGKRVQTVTNSLLNVALAIIWAITVLVVLDQFGVSLAPLFAAAGIAGLAFGFGAQTLVRDGLSGFFILLENQFDLGDTIDALTTAGMISGRIEAFTFRVTSIRSFDGTLHYVPNGNIQVVSNKSKGWARAIVDLRVAPDEDVERVRHVLGELFEELRRDDGAAGTLKGGPDLLGVETIAVDGLVLRIVADTRPSARVDVERTLRERIAARFAERGIRVPAGAAPAARPGP
jgi:small-conductance mechanosensitive channel